MENEGQDAVARLFRRVERNSMEVIAYANDRRIPGTASEQMTSKFSWYKGELISDFQRTFDDLGRDKTTSFLFLVCVWFGFYLHSYKVLKIKNQNKWNLPIHDMGEDAAAL
ncbi:hypothetical protein O181_004477 [Austropuccinia psidii MF-1]|uniref:Uncharacterized protein n=1 Tax=Austropuccinia psidii MF-1 TaxID=1389203 RepID=A0A9Q3BGV7_9BASI|nr:hypothetical protein [Austropuccinia psidii MF-1]